MSNVVDTFSGVLDCLVPGDTYRKSPPYGPPEGLPALTSEELDTLQRTPFGEELRGDSGFSTYKHLKMAEDYRPKPVEFPSSEDIAELNVCGIDGSNQKVERSTFYFLLARASVVEFRYSKNNIPPYFYNRNVDASGVVWVDGNIFSQQIIHKSTVLPTEKDKTVNVLDKLQGNLDKPFLVRHDPGQTDKSPNNHALGWAVKLQQALELKCLSYIPTDVETVCIKDGPLFSTSVSPRDTREALDVIYQWKNQILVACSKRVKDSSLLLEALKFIPQLRDLWFPGQNLTDDTLKNLSTDSILLPRLLKPGYRTPLIEAVQTSRFGVVDPENHGDPNFIPLSCYYLSKHQPHTYIRLEIPKMQWEKNQAAVERAISIVAWQHELGHKAPLVQVAADRRCQLGYEKMVLEKQTISQLNRNNLELPEDY